MKAGVVLAGLEPPGGQQLELFEQAPAAKPAELEPRGAQLIATLGGLHERFGRGTGRLAAALGPKGGGEARVDQATVLGAVRRALFSDSRARRLG